MTYETSISARIGPPTKPDADKMVIGNFPDGRSQLGDWWRDPSKARQHFVAIAVAVAGVVSFIVGVAQLWDIYVAGSKKADEVTIIYNQEAATLLPPLFEVTKDIKPSMEDIDAARAAGDENKAYYMTVAYKAQAAAIIKGDFKMNDTIQTFYTAMNNTAICATDGCSRTALIRNMETAYCRADRKFGGWLVEYRKKPFKAAFAQQYVDLLATIPCDAVIYPKTPTN
ncbi:MULTISPECIES: hypothetical protein [unclassified Neorhizobium]|uniref:hypothetical protein n=1 Tax=unclassified Neorhizobium TaxID=2629175 RepID=UPI001FF16913|nr:MULTISPECIES: hypothetical protein [unclassified Neorhizobium]MCJ9668540.1 hypothetical protein [Neorhizobium sp. SHOUNA12B]MCJ9744243.1 hypothetical protein [Neorhizobium sp. SHOUNA12A]